MLKETEEKDLILNAMNLIDSKTNGCISFIEKSSSDVNWLNINDPGNGKCSSTVSGTIPVQSFH